MSSKRNPVRDAITYAMTAPVGEVEQMLTTLAAIVHNRKQTDEVSRDLRRPRAMRQANASVEAKSDAQ